MTIYVPDELFDRMQKIRARTGPNWSRVASDAFEQVLLEVHKAKAPTMTTAIRLPYPTTGDYDLFDVKHARGRFKIKVSRSAIQSRWPQPLERVVARYAADAIENNPGLEPGDVLPRTVTTTVVEDVLKGM